MHIYQFVSSDVVKDLLFVFEFGESSQFVFSTAQKMKFSIKDFFSKCDQIRSFLRIWSHLPKKSLIENFIFCEVFIFQFPPYSIMFSFY